MASENVVRKLLEPFPADRIKRRDGPKDKKTGKPVDLFYVEGGDVKHRLIEATGNQYDFEILEIRGVPASSVVKQGRENSEYTVYRSEYFYVRVRLTIEGLGFREAVGTQVVENEDSLKGAITDALKVAASYFGVALDLYRDEGGSTLDLRAAYVDWTDPNLLKAYEDWVAAQKKKHPGIEIEPVKWKRPALIDWLIAHEEE